jgi:hypothetical protein
MRQELKQGRAEEVRMGRVESSVMVMVVSVCLSLHHLSIQKPDAGVAASLVMLRQTCAACQTLQAVVAMPSYPAS